MLHLTIRKISKTFNTYLLKSEMVGKTFSALRKELEANEATTSEVTGAAVAATNGVAVATGAKVGPTDGRV